MKTTQATLESAVENYFEKLYYLKNNNKAD